MDIPKRDVKGGGGKAGMGADNEGGKTEEDGLEEVSGGDV
jgi:hypothetical protein